MKYILTFLFSFLLLSSYAQEPAYTPMRLNYQFRGIKVDSLFLIPSFTDTTAANLSTMKNVAGAMIRTGNDFWMRNSTTTGWLQNVNVGTGASVAVQFVDTIYRIPGKDSIFWKKGGVTNKIKDSISTDSPDRIDGIATSKVISNFANYDWDIQQITNLNIYADTAEYQHENFSIVSNQVYISGAGTKGLDFYIDTNLLRINAGNKTMLQIDTLGNFQAGDLTKDSLIIVLNETQDKITLRSPNPVEWSDPVSGIKSQVKTGRGVSGIDLSSVDYFAKLPGVYQITTATTNDFYLPDAALFEGQTVHVINTDGSDANLLSDGGAINDATNVSITSIKTNRYYIFSSDGSNWWGMWHVP